jgi:hypothetical protein
LRTRYVSVTGHPQQHLRADFAANKRGVVIVLANMDAMGAKLEGKAPVIIDEKNKTEFVANRQQGLR